jgi:hypothetical protein
MKLLRGFSVFVVFILGLVLFAPKVNAYYWLEKVLLQKRIIIANEQVSQRSLQLQLQQMNIYYAQKNVSDIKKASLTVGVVSNVLLLNDITIKKELKRILPTMNIDQIQLLYHLWDPLRVHIKAQGVFGQAQGTYNLLENKGSLSLNASTSFKKNNGSFLRKMKLDKGVYIYEYQL